jgi:hypothetical protein
LIECQTEVAQTAMSAMLTHRFPEEFGKFRMIAEKTFMAQTFTVKTRMIRIKPATVF